MLPRDRFQKVDIPTNTYYFAVTEEGMDKVDVKKGSP
jgi:hypothetical protein